MPHYDIAARAIVVALKVLPEIKSNAEVERLTGVPARTVGNIYAKAIANGFNPDPKPLVIKDAFLEDHARSGRPTKQTPESKAPETKAVRTYPDGSAESEMRE